jgi:biopolymer transport protein ExbD
MLIITIPPQTHATKLDLPAALPLVRILATSNEVAVRSDGAFTWNGRRVSDGDLGVLLDATQQRRPIPELHLRPDPTARYDDVARLLGLVRHEQVAKVGFVGNEAYARW